MPVIQFHRKEQTELAAAKTFESPTAELLAEQHPVAKRAVLYVLAAMIALLVTYISIAHLDRIVKTTGRIVPVGGAITVQPLDKAIIRNILVSVGDTVKKGQVLATMDSTFVQADLSETQNKVESLSPEKRRIEAEEAGQAFRPDPAKPYDQLQDTIFRQRSTQFDAGVQDFDQRIKSTQAQIAGLEGSGADYRERLKIAREEEDMNVKLEAAGVISRLQLIGVQDQRIELERKLSEVENNLDSERHTLASLQEQRSVYIDNWHNDNLNNLVTVGTKLDDAKQDQVKALKYRELSTLASPVDGVVLKIPKLSAGGVATDAEPLFSLMPMDAKLEAEVEIDAKDSGFVRPGDPVRIKLETYQFLEHGTAEGFVRTISRDSFIEPTGQDTLTKNSQSGGNELRTPYFDARITITAVKLHDVPSDTQLIPGMTLQADIVVGRRTIIWYLVGGALRSGAEAMREP